MAGGRGFRGWMIGMAALGAAMAGGTAAAQPAPPFAEGDPAAVPVFLPLTDALTAPTRRAASRDGALAIAYSIERGTADPQRLSDLAASEAREAGRLRSARVVARIAPGASFGFAFSEGLDRLVAELRDGARPRFLVAGDPLEDIGFRRREQTALALRRDFGFWGLTASAEQGQPAGDAGAAFGGRIDRRRTAASAARYGLTADGGFGNLTAALGASWLRERQTILGARVRDGFNAGRADSLFLDGALAWHPHPGWRLGAAWRHGVTRAAAIGGGASGVLLTSDAWAVDMTRLGVFGAADSLSLRVSQPLRVGNGAGFGLPVEYSYETRGDARVATSVTLAPTGREIAAELNWQGPLLRGQATAGLFYRKDPGHLAALPNDHGAAVSWAARF